MFTSIGLSALNGIGYVAEGFDRLKPTSSSIPRATEGEAINAPFQGAGRKVREREAQRRRQEEDSRRRRATTIMSTHWNYSNIFPCGRASAVADDSEPSGRASVSNATDAPLSGAHVSSYQTPYQIQHEWAENVARAKEQFRILVGCNEVLDVNGNRIRAQLRNLEGRRSELEFSVSGLISHQNQLAILNSTAETDLLAVKTSLEDLRAQHGHVEVTIREAQDQLARTTEAVTDRRVHLNTLQVEAERFQAAINERTSELATVGNALRVTQADVDRTRAALASDKAQVAATQVELRSVKDATTKENKQTEEALIERKRMWASIDRARADLEKVQASAIEERADAKRRLDDLRADIAKAGEKKEAKKKELAEYVADGKQKLTSVNDEIKKARAAHGVELASMKKTSITAQTELNRTNEAVSAARRGLAQERLQLQEIRDVITRDAAYLERLRQETAVVHEFKAQAEANLKATDEDLDKLAAMVVDAEHELLQVQAARDKALSELYVIQEKIGQEASLATSDLVQRAHEDASIRTEAAYAFVEAQTDIQDMTHLTDVPQMDTLSNHDVSVDPVNIPIPNTPDASSWIKNKALVDATQNGQPSDIHSAPITPPLSPIGTFDIPRTRIHSEPGLPQSSQPARMHSTENFRRIAAQTGRVYPGPRTTSKVPSTKASAESVETNLPDAPKAPATNISFTEVLEPSVELMTPEPGLFAVTADVTTDSALHLIRSSTPTTGAQGANDETQVLQKNPPSPPASELGTDDTIAQKSIPTNAGLLLQDSTWVDFAPTIHSNDSGGVYPGMTGAQSSGQAAQGMHTVPSVQSTIHEDHAENPDRSLLEGLLFPPAVPSPVLRRADHAPMQEAQTPDITSTTASHDLRGGVQAFAHDSELSSAALSRSSRRGRGSTSRASETSQHRRGNCPISVRAPTSPSSESTATEEPYGVARTRDSALTVQAQPQADKPIKNGWWSSWLS